MKLRSFRLRIALLSTVLAGTALTGFSLLAWVQIYEAKLSRLDAALADQIRRAIRPPFPEARVGHNDPSHVTSTVALRVADAQGRLMYQSPLVANDGDLDQALATVLQRAPRPPTLLDSPDLPDPPLPPEGPPRSPRPPRDALSAPRFQTVKTPTDTWRMGAMQLPEAGVAIALSLDSVDQEMAAIRDRFLILIPGVLVLVAGGAWGLSGTALRPVRQLVTAVRRVTAQGLDQRIPVGDTDREFVALIEGFNQMLERLDHSFRQASRFSGDAAHELKTPLAILQGQLERKLQGAELGSETQQMFGDLLDEVGRLSTIVRKLLLLSLADAGRMNLQAVPVDLSVLLAEMLEDMDLLAPDLTVQAEIAEGLQVLGDRDLLSQIFQNLLSNGIKYNLPQGWIRIHGCRVDGEVRVTVVNASKGMARAEGDRIFDRFHRGDPARTRRIDGAGLGLSLAREIARAHGGDLRLDPLTPGQTGFTLSLPMARA